jgi:hypothetical protein
MKEGQDRDLVSLAAAQCEVAARAVLCSTQLLKLVLTRRFIFSAQQSQNLVFLASLFALAHSGEAALHQPQRPTTRLVLLDRSTALFNISLCRVARDLTTSS